MSEARKPEDDPDFEALRREFGEQGAREAIGFRDGTFQGDNLMELPDGTVVARPSPTLEELLGDLVDDTKGGE